MKIGLTHISLPYNYMKMVFSKSVTKKIKKASLEALKSFNTEYHVTLNGLIFNKLLPIDYNKYKYRNTIYLNIKLFNRKTYDSENFIYELPCIKFNRGDSIELRSFTENYNNIPKFGSDVDLSNEIFTYNVVDRFITPTEASDITIMSRDEITAFKDVDINKVDLELDKLYNHHNDIYHIVDKGYGYIVNVIDDSNEIVFYVYIDGYNKNNGLLIRSFKRVCKINVIKFFENSPNHTNVEDNEIFDSVYMLLSKVSNVIAVPEYEFNDIINSNLTKLKDHINIVDEIEGKYCIDVTDIIDENINKDLNDVCKARSKELSIIFNGSKYKIKNRYYLNIRKLMNDKMDESILYNHINIPHPDSIFEFTGLFNILRNNMDSNVLFKILDKLYHSVPSEKDRIFILYLIKFYIRK